MDDTVVPALEETVFTNRLSCHLPRFVILLSLFPFCHRGSVYFREPHKVIIIFFMPRIRKKLPWKKMLRDGEYLLWVHMVLPRLGLNYSQPNFYQRTHIPYTEHTHRRFFKSLWMTISTHQNSSFVPVKGIHEEQVRDEVVKLTIN